MRRLMPVALGLIFAIVPLFPSFIALTAVNYPGVSLVPHDATLLVLGLCAVLAVYALVVLATSSAVQQPLLVPLLAVFGAGILAGTVGFDPRAGLLFTGIGGLGVVWHCAVVRFYTTRYAAVTIFSAFVGSGVLATAISIAMAIAHFPANLYAIAHGRATGTFILPGELAGYLIVLLPIAWVLGSTARWQALRALSWTAFALGCIAMALTYSRAGWMGLAGAFAFLFAIRTRRASTAILLLAGGVVAVLLLFNVHHDPSEDFTRLSIWQAAMQVADRFPLTGVGPFNFSRLYPLARAPDADPTAFHAHSAYLTFFVEFGILGLSAVIWTVWRFAAELRRRALRAGEARAFLAAGVAAGLVGAAVQGLIDTVTVVIFGLWMPMMALALAAAQGGDPDVVTERSCASIPS